MNRRILLILLIFAPAIKCWGQNKDEVNNDNKLDTLKINTFTLNLDLLLYFSNKEMAQYPELKAINAAQIQYLLKDTEFALYFRQILDRLNNGYLYYNHYLNLSADIFKYKSLGKGLFPRIFYPEPVFIYQNNSERGLSRRFQTGLFFNPLRYFRPNIKINFGLGCLYDWSAWEVNNSDKIAACPPDMKEKILFINSHTKLRDDLYMDFSEWRPTLFLNLSYQTSDVLNLGLFSSYQQSLVSPFNETIKAAYPELKKVYPYSYSSLYIGTKVYKGLALKMSFIVDYENNNLSIYSSSWEYDLVLGVTWSFSNKGYLPVIFKTKHKNE